MTDKFSKIHWTLKICLNHIALSRNCISCSAPLTCRKAFSLSFILSCPLLSGHAAPFVRHDYKYLHLLYQHILHWSLGSVKLVYEFEEASSLKAATKMKPGHRITAHDGTTRPFQSGNSDAQNTEEFKWVVFKVCKIGMKFQDLFPMHLISLLAVAIHYGRHIAQISFQENGSKSGAF